MSTRGAIALGTQKAWLGVYNHMDSYPTGLGKDLWNAIKTRGFDRVVDNIRNSKNPLDGSPADPESYKTVDPLYIEWVYIINPDTRNMCILKSVPKSDPSKMKSKYKEAYVGTISLNGEEPNWEAVEKLGENINDAAHKKFENVYHISSSSNPSKRYDVTLGFNPSCTCMDYIIRKNPECKHILVAKGMERKAMEKPARMRA